MPSIYLAHHGILGQKWGVRRYQNPDGSLTEAGKRRYLKADGSSKKSKLGSGNYGRASDYYTSDGRGDLTPKGKSLYNKTLKELKTTNAKKYISSSEYGDTRLTDFKLYGPLGVEHIAKRLDKGDSLKRARSKELLFQVGIGTAVFAPLTVAVLMAEKASTIAYGNTLASTYFNTAGKLYRP